MYLEEVLFITQSSLLQGTKWHCMCITVEWYELVHAQSIHMWAIVVHLPPYHGLHSLHTPHILHCPHHPLVRLVVQLSSSSQPENRQYRVGYQVMGKVNCTCWVLWSLQYELCLQSWPTQSSVLADRHRQYRPWKMPKTYQFLTSPFLPPLSVFHFLPKLDLTLYRKQFSMCLHK